MQPNCPWLQPREETIPYVACPCESISTNSLLVEFAVAYVSEVQWAECSFEDVNIPAVQKKAIYALTKTYLNKKADDNFHDLVQGKGRGINFLL